VAHEVGGVRFEAIYAHFSQKMVSPGQPVEVGTVLGLSGNTGNSTGPHLHFEIRPESTVQPGTVVSGAYADGVVLERSIANALNGWISSEAQ
jgi:murein DD-endopeptidase MepM/ murein hydrolase activator NlpD